MKTHFAIAAFICLVLIFSVLSRPEAVVANALQKSVKIECLMVKGSKVVETVWSGSGSFITRKGAVLTNKHVVKNCVLLEVFNFEGDSLGVYTSDDVVESSKADLAVIKTGLRGLPYFNGVKMPRLGSEVYVIGSPLGQDFSVSKGIVSSIARSQDEMKLIQVDAAINSGNSGGALIDAYGNLIGVPVSILTNSKRGGFIGIGFAVSPVSINEFLNQLTI